MGLTFGRCSHCKDITTCRADCALQLQAIRAERGASANDSEAPLKPLVDVLREAKEAKEEAFQAVWRSMKTGVPCYPLFQNLHESQTRERRLVS